MRGRSFVVAACAVVFAGACGTGDTRIDPSDLELRDLLGVSPEAAGAWDLGQREAARRVLVEALDHGSEPVEADLVAASAVDDQVTRSLASLDGRRFAAGDGALGLVRMTIAGGELTGATREAPTVAATAAGDAGPVVTLQLSDRWGTVPARSREVLAALAIDSGHTGDTLVVVPAPRLTVIASYVATTPPRLVVNPVLLAAIDPTASAMMTTSAPSSATARRTGPDPSAVHPAAPTAIAGGNPYSFYGSIGECAYAQRTRCESCLTAGNCEPITTSDGNTECTRLGENDGRGYYLICINLALAITSVESCAADGVSGCARDTDAASSLSQLENNASFLDDSTCGTGLDRCLADIFGAPTNPFPGIVDGGVDPPPEPPRSTDVSCNDSCNSDNNSNCEFSPNCDCSGPSCGNSLSCDSGCSDSNTQSGCGDNCDSCSSSSGGSSGGGGGCSSSSGGSSGGGDCGGGDCGGGSCGGGDCGGGSCGGGGGGGGGCGGGCQVAKKPPSAVFGVALSLTWALLPVPVAAMLRRRSKKKKKPSRPDAEPTKEVSL
jgi:hypothetical protein